MKVVGRVWINGEYKGENVITVVGLGICTSLISGTSTTPVKYIAIGKGALDEGVTNTVLADEVDRKLADISIITTDYTNDTIKYTATFTLLSDTTVTEIGLFDAASSGNLFARKVLDPGVFVPGGDTLEVTYEVQFGY